MSLGPVMSVGPVDVKAAAKSYPAVERLCKSLLLSNPAIQTPFKRVLTLKVTATLLEGFKFLLKNKILSAPVLDDTKAIGFLDIRDLVSFVNHLAQQQQQKRRQSWERRKGPRKTPRRDLLSMSSADRIAHTGDARRHSYSSSSDRDSEESKPSASHRVVGTAAGSGGPGSKAASQSPARSQKTFRAPLQRIINIAALEPKITVRYLARRNPFKPLHTTSTLWDAVNLMATRVKRVPVLDPEGKLVNVVTQSSVVRLLGKAMEKAPDVKRELSRVTAMEIGTRPVVTVHKDTTAAAVFKVMAEKNLSGIAVVDQHKTFLCATTGSDLSLYMSTGRLSILQMPIRQFLAQVRQQEMDDILPNASVRSNATLAHIIAKIAVLHQHRAFVADANKGLRPAAVVSISDILTELSGIGPIPSKSPRLSLFSRSRASSDSNLTTPSSSSSRSDKLTLSPRKPRKN